MVSHFVPPLTRDDCTESGTGDDRTESKVQSLLAANQVLVTELSLPAVLHRVVATAREVADAQYAALGVIGPDGRLEQFVHDGIDDPTVQTMGDLPKGRGLLGELLSDPRPIRLPTVQDSPHSSGVPLNHPPIGAFLGVPVRSATSIYGNLYLANRVGGQQFSDEDETLVLALAASAGIAVENARLYEQATRRQEWLRAAADISQRLLQSEGPAEVLDLLAEQVLRLARADTVTLVVPVGPGSDLLQVTAVAGRGANQLRGVQYPLAGSLVGRVLEGERGMLVDAVDKQDLSVRMSDLVPVREVMVFALKGEGPPLGALVVARANEEPFTPADLDLAEAFAEQATLALEHTVTRGDRFRLQLLEDRARIARDLHDHVVQRLFAAGLTLKAVSRGVQDPDLRRQLTAMIDGLDTTIRRIRAFIAELQDIAIRTRSVRLTVMATLADAAPLLGVCPAVVLRGPLDTVVEDDQADEVGRVLRDRLRELARAEVSVVEVELALDGGRLVLTVADDGPPPNAATVVPEAGARAELTLTTSPLGGGLLRWSAPLAL